MLIFGILVTILVVSMLIGTMLHATLFTSKKNRIEQNSQLVAVEMDPCMSVVHHPYHVPAPSM